MPGLQKSAATGVVEAVSREPMVEGVFLAGSLVGEGADPFSDVDLGIVTIDGADQAALADMLGRRVVDQLGEPVHRLERGWNRCRMMALLFGRQRFPPLGLEVDLVWGKLADVGDQMPYGPYEVLFDRLGRLSPALDALPGQPARADVVQELCRHLHWFPFLVHDTVKAVHRSARRGEPGRIIHAFDGGAGIKSYRSRAIAGCWSCLGCR